MGIYFLKLVILLPLVGGLAWASLWLWKRVQLGLPVGRVQERPVRLIDAVPLGTGSKLAVVSFDDRELLVAVTRGQVTLLTEARAEFIDG
ncbi:flagellar biogenesis protein FliO [Sphingomonas ginkgonis]|uniref:Flagellar biogenesis protein FliO n=1 Tax=Sphingomonas ginkgonis TaxID=2315330 RepID=A0A429VCD4_9SPHN|nr:flagellar biosynthetic protein FliO [Sphingomonas ginkgonis]RST31561.1 flagellar biogenesis protein FliO [Sphingomonas ginkgonis]